MKRSHDSRAVVTGAGSGIGQAFAVELAARGGSVVCSDIDEPAAQRTVDAIIDQGGKALAVRCDVSSIQDVHVLANEAWSWFGGPPSFVVNNAGVGAGGAVSGRPRWPTGSGFSASTSGASIHGCHVFAPILREAGAGSIINVASAASFGAAPRMGPTTSARQAPSRCPRPSPRNWRAAVCTSACSARRS